MIWMTALAAPLLYFLPGMDAGGRMENTVDTIAMMANGPVLSSTVALYWVTVLGTNMYGVLVSAQRDNYPVEGARVLTQAQWQIPQYKST